MRNQIPEPDTHAVYQHKKFDKILKEFALPKATAVKVFLDATVKGSDIKWNDMAGTLVMKALDKDDKEMAKLFSCELTRFTGNCGVKAISHLYLHHNNKDSLKELLTIIESFAYHKTNCGILVGSDTTHGNTLRMLEAYGKGYNYTKPTWNPNYTCSKEHEVKAFWKDLNGETHNDYWGK